LAELGNLLNLESTAILKIDWGLGHFAPQKSTAA
jgi:hypothetical protein